MPLTLTLSSAANQTALEKEGDEHSLLTKHIIAGIQTGEAANQSTGLVTMEDLYRYVHARVRAEGHQEPERWALNVRGEDLVLARVARNRVDRLRELDVWVLQSASLFTRKVRIRAQQVIDECQAQPDLYAGHIRLLEALREFCKKLQQMTKRTYRLPSEAEWEYACRAGTTGDYAGEIEKMAWYRDNSKGKTHPVGQKQPNAFGLYDMHGNVWEWCEDVWHDNYKSAPDDGSAWLSEGDLSLHLLRGGSWICVSSDCRSACRGSDRFVAISNGSGFRVVVSARNE
jgi:hypothetical protein